MPIGDERSLKSARLDQVIVFGADVPVEDVLSEAAASERSWVAVVRDDGMPMALVPPQWLMSAGDLDPRWPIGVVVVRSSPFLIAASSTTYASVFEQAGEFQLEPSAPVAVFEDGRIVGVSTVERLQRDLFNVRFGGTTLPGKPQIPLIIRKCEYREANSNCIHVEQFQARPSVMPPCPNPMHLQPHDFLW